MLPQNNEKTILPQDRDITIRFPDAIDVYINVSNSQHRKYTYADGETARVRVVDEDVTSNSVNLKFIGKEGIAFSVDRAHFEVVE